MSSDHDLSVVRAAFAKQIAHLARADDPRVEQALVATRREHFLPSGPWDLVCGTGGYLRTPSDDPVYLYQDLPVAIMPEKQLNNGQPSFITALIAAMRPRAGGHAVHVGCGSGYYTALISLLVGAQGRVTAIEAEAGLAAQATSNLSCYPNVTVAQGDGAAMPMAPADAILVNAGASRPADIWLDALQPGGRLVLPLTVPSTAGDFAGMTQGAVFLIERVEDGFDARYLSPTLIYPCAGARDEASEAALAEAFRRGGIRKVTRLRRTDDGPLEDCWMQAPGWSLAFR